MTKQDIVESLVARGLLCKTFDYALPQGWLDQFQGEEYDRVRSSTVWAYPEGSAFGEPVDINKLYQEATMIQRPELKVEVLKVPEGIYEELKEQAPWLFGDGDTETPCIFTTAEMISAEESFADEECPAKAWLTEEIDKTSKWALVAFERPDVNFSAYYQITATKE